MKKHRCEIAVEKLVEAYHRQFLIHGEPCACAVGNLCNGNPSWVRAINGTHRKIYPNPGEICLIEGLNYSPEELKEIEKEFEGREKEGGAMVPKFDGVNDPSGIKGLRRVFEVFKKLDRDFFRANSADLNFYLKKYKPNTNEA